MMEGGKSIRYGYDDKKVSCTHFFFFPYIWVVSRSALIRTNVGRCHCGKVGWGLKLESGEKSTEGDFETAGMG